ncbi:MAG: amidohydrolase family protein [Opitutaceae bacterium]|nr:amidohydrolase family protein [Opitutaceae bacterium]
MNYAGELTRQDERLAAALSGFLPAEIYDIHAHPFAPDCYPPGTWDFLDARGTLGCAEHRAALRRYMKVAVLHGLYFGLPHPAADRPRLNSWVHAEVARHGTPRSRALLLVSPDDDPALVAAQLRGGQFCGLKVYSCYIREGSMSAAPVEAFAPEWMWELLHETRGILMLHLMRDRGIDDPLNQASIRRLCRAYPRMRLVLPHVARSFNYRNARAGLHAIADLGNAVVDTSAICELEVFRVALQLLGPRRVLWGSDYATSEMRGRAVTVGAGFFWLHPDLEPAATPPGARADMSLIGIESLLSLQEACTDAGLTAGDLRDIFLANALRLLEPHLPAEPGSAPAAP